MKKVALLMKPLVDAADVCCNGIRKRTKPKTWNLLMNFNVKCRAKDRLSGPNPNLNFTSRQFQFWRQKVNSKALFGYFIELGRDRWLKSLAEF